MKFLLFLLLAYLTFRFLQNLMSPRRNQNSGGFRVIFPDQNSSPKEKDISDKVKIISKEE